MLECLTFEVFENRTCVGCTDHCSGPHSGSFAAVIPFAVDHTLNLAQVERRKRKDRAHAHVPKDDKRERLRSVPG